MIFFHPSTQKSNPMKNILILSVVLGFFSNIGLSQYGGFFGKKNMFAIDLRMYSPIIYGLTTLSEENAKTQGSKFAPQKNLIDYGVNFTLGRAFSRSFGLSFQFGISQYDFILKSEGGIFSYYNYQNYDLIKSNWFQTKTMTFMPILEFSGRGGLLPLGLSHQLGIGLVRHHLKEKKYHVLLSDGYSQENVNTFIYNYKNKPIQSLLLMYKINLRIPITNYLLFNIGFRYNLNYFNDLDLLETGANDIDYLVSRSTLRDNMRAKEFSNVMSLETGLTLSF